MEPLAFLHIAVALETDPTRYHGPDAAGPSMLDKSDAEQLVAHVAADLKALMPEMASCALVAPGALFDQAQLMRPGFPVFAALAEVLPTPHGDEFKPGLVSVGTRDGRMPSNELQPDDDLPPGPMQFLPVVVQGPRDLVAALEETMEYRFIEEGQVSAHSASWLQAAFSITVNHARFMTLTDMNAMLRLQLEHFGFLPLWELLDAALDGRDTQSVKTDLGDVFEWRDGAVHTRFQTFDFWAQKGAGCELPSERAALAPAYADWTREARQYATTLEAYGLPLVIHDPHDDRAIEQSFFCEESEAGPLPGAATVTEHGYDDIGTIAVTLVHDGKAFHFYPVRARGLNEIQDRIRKTVTGGYTVAYPCDLLYDEARRCLVPETETDS